MKTSILALMTFLATTVAASAQSDKSTSGSDRQLQIEKLFVYCESDQEKKFEAKPSAFFVKQCGGKHRCFARVYFPNTEMICPRGKRHLVATVRCGSEDKELTSTGRHRLVCTERQFTIDGK
jgi:hypothetical protein